MAKTGLSTRDWGIVLGAVAIAVAVLGFIYAPDTTGVGEAGLEPASGAIMAPATTSDDRGDVAPYVNPYVGDSGAAPLETTPEDAPELVPPVEQ